MSNLTEQWKKGELKDGWYYVMNNAHSIKFNQLAYYSELGDSKFWYGCKDADIKEVLAPVPSYEEWQEEQKSLKVLAEEYCKEKEENDKLKTENKWYSEQLNEAVKEVSQLKELLKECKKELKPLWDEWLYDYGDKTGNNSARFLRIDDLLTKIDNAIGEQK